MRDTYKVVTQELRSLGLRRNPTILTYPVGVWVQNPSPIIHGPADHGGIWTARTQGNARRLQAYMRERYALPVRIFRAHIGDVLYENSYRIKTDRIQLLDEII